MCDGKNTDGGIIGNDDLGKLLNFGVLIVLFLKEEVIFE